MIPVIGIAGPAGSGKTSLAEMLLASPLGEIYQLYGMAWPLKSVVNTLFCWGEEHAEGELKEVIDPRVGISPRQAYQKIGTEIFRDRLNDALPDIAIPSGDLWVWRAHRHLEQNGPLIIADIRFPNEVEWIDYVGGLLVHVARRGEYGLNSEAKKHPSEAGLPSRVKDHMIKPCVNLEELAVEARALIGYITATLPVPLSNVVKVETK